MSDDASRHPGGRRRAVELYLTIALALALGPAALLAVGRLAVEAGLADWRGGLGLFALDWAPRLALAGVVSGGVALVVALLAGFRRYWRRALVILAITAATLGGYLWISARPDSAGPSAPAAPVA